MRILIAVHGYPPVDVGGAERRAERTARLLHERGHEVRAFAIAARDGRRKVTTVRDSIDEGIRVRRLHIGLDVRTDPIDQEFDNPHAECAFGALLAEWRPDLVHMFSGYLLSGSVARATRAADLPLVVSLTDYWWLCHRITLVKPTGERCDGPTPIDCARCRAEIFRRYRWPARALPVATDRAWESAAAVDRVSAHLGIPAFERRIDELRLILQRADACIAPSAYLAERYLEHGIAPGRMHVWRQGADVNECMLPAPDDTLRVGYLGQIRPHKGIHLLLDAWSRLTGNRTRSLTLYGSCGGDRGYARTIRTALRNTSDAEWIGEFRGGEVWHILSRLDLLVAPSRWAENSPNSIVEAQAVGLPVLGARIGGISEMISDGRTGLLFEPDNAGDLAETLQTLLDDRTLLHRLRRTCKPFQTMDAEIDLIDGVYRTVLAERCAGRHAADPLDADRCDAIVSRERLSRHSPRWPH